MISEAAVYIQKKNVKIVSLNSTVAVDVWQTLIISMERSMIVMILAVRCSVNVWNVHYDQSSTGRCIMCNIESFEGMEERERK